LKRSIRKPILLAALVTFGLRELGVLRAIYLHNQSRGGCIEIGDVVTDWLLSVELYAEDLLST
jgi:hypothetical protein